MIIQIPWRLEWSSLDVAIIENIILILKGFFTSWNLGRIHTLKFSQGFEYRVPCFSSLVLSTKCFIKCQSGDKKEGPRRKTLQIHTKVRANQNTRLGIVFFFLFSGVACSFSRLVLVKVAFSILVGSESSPPNSCSYSCRSFEYPLV